MKHKKNEYDIDKLIEKLYSCKPLKSKELIFIIEKSKEIISKENNVLEVQCPITICGDIFGRFHNLVELFNLGGRIPYTNYIFMGNYINKGYYSIETLSLLLCLKIRYPKRIYLLRGNHECSQYSIIYGFYDECIRKYGYPGIYNYFIDLFKYFPLAALIEGKILCLHSGLSPSIKTIDDIKLINRVQDDYWEDDIFLGLLYNEPGDCSWFTPYSKGSGYIFGENISKEFCRVNGLDLIVRGSCYIPKGYKLMHDNKVCSICSSPNAYYRNDNEGAIMEVDENKNYNFYQFDCAPRRGKTELMEKTPDCFYD